MGTGIIHRASDGIGVIELPPLAGGVLAAGDVAALGQALDACAALPGVILDLHGNAHGPVDPAGLVPPEGLAALAARIASAAPPVVAVLAGPVTGPLASLALAAQGRVMADGAALAWPEAEMALLPPAGAVVRLTHLAGAAALEIAGSGRRIPAREALALGLVDALVPDREAAHARARTLVQAPPRRLRGDVSADFAAVQAARRALAQGPGVAAAPARLLDAVEAALLLPDPQALAFAAEAEADARADPVGRALRYLMQAERRLGPPVVTAATDGAPTLTQAGMEAAGALRAAWVLAARALVREGTAPGTIDAAARHWGHAEGPLGTAPPPRAGPEIATRLVAALLAEAARLVAGGALDSPAQADALAVMATGFPRWRGGPVLASIALGQGVLARQMEGWAQGDPVWEMPDIARHAILVAGRWGDAGAV
ncbi:MAG: enoyl-CoA hydratase/isomerase family protein [Rubellimicrobium sp.]|nr:enoyl-CoA hydratase/isomerase family protein [Rubellimicrobium sp.]